MEYADLTLELLLTKYHSVPDNVVAERIEQEVKRRTLTLDDLGMINNAFHQCSNLRKRARLRNWALDVLREQAICIETSDLVALYKTIAGQGVIGHFITEHLKERLVKPKSWHEIICDFENVEMPLTSYGVNFILQHSTDAYMLADIHMFTNANSHLRSRLTKMILAMKGRYSYLDWEEIATRCAYPSYLYNYANDELERLCYADEDLPEDTHSNDE